MPRLDWTASAKRDLSQIADYIARVDQRPTVAESLVDAIVEKARSYALFTKTSQRVSDSLFTSDM